MGKKFTGLEESLKLVSDAGTRKDVRIRELGMIEDYADGLVNLTVEGKAKLKAVIDAFKFELFDGDINEECIGGYYRILLKLINMEGNLKGKKCIIYGNNWLSAEIERKMASKNYHVFNWRNVNPDYMDEYDLHILCDEPLKVYGIAALPDKDKVIKLWDYLKYKFGVFPAVYRTITDMEEAAGSGVKGIITGGRNTVYAIHSSLLHKKTVSVANRSQDIFYDFKLFCHAYESMPDLEYVIVGLAPYSLRYDTSKSNAEWRRCLVYYPVVETMHNCNGADQLIELYKTEYFKVKNYFESGYVESLYDLYVSSETKTEEAESCVFDDSAMTQEVTEHNIREINALYNRPHTEILLQNKVLLQEYAHFCQMKGIRVIFFIPPYTKWYKEHMKKSYYEELVSTVKMLCEKYGAQFIDMMNVSLPDRCFRDYASINDIGAIKVASYINEVLEKGKVEK